MEKSKYVLDENDKVQAAFDEFLKEIEDDRQFEKAFMLMLGTQVNTLIGKFFTDKFGRDWLVLLEEILKNEKAVSGENEK